MSRAIIRRSMLSALAAFPGAALAETGEPGTEASARSLYGISAVNEFCAQAQRTVTATRLDVANVIHTSWPAFVESDAEPYSVVGGSVELTYTPPEAPERPLSSRQYVFYGKDRAFPSVISCKMKSADYLNRTVPGLSAVDRGCREVSSTLVSDVMASLTPRERRRIRRTPVVEDDVVVGSGPEWTSGFPEDPYPVLYRSELDGPLRIRASALHISPHPDDVPAPSPYFNFIEFCNATGGDQGFLGSACEPRKWGVRYCHLPSPHYLRRALTRRVSVPTCGTETGDPRVCTGPGASPEPMGS